MIRSNLPRALVLAGLLTAASGCGGGGHDASAVDAAPGPARPALHHRGRRPPQ